MAQDNYRNTKEIKYYGSDYNKFLYTDCTKEMTVNNIDVIQYKDFYTGKKIVRICESKHENEGWGKNQKLVLKMLAKAFRILNRMSVMKTEFQIFLVRANPPYEIAKITNFITNKSCILNKQQLIAFSNLEYDPTK